MLKRYFIITNGYNCVVYADGEGKAYMIPEQAWDEVLTLEVARATDYSNFDGCETVENCAANGVGEKNIVDFNIDDYAVSEDCRRYPDQSVAIEF